MWIPDSKTSSGIAEVPLTDIAADAFRRHLALSGPGPYLFSIDVTADGYQKSSRPFGTRHCVGQGSILSPVGSPLHVRDPAQCRGVADKWVTQLLRQGDAKVFRKYSQMKLQMKRKR
ncbi:MAG TPA: hypothetical protein VGL82_01075 [Bryobacteraceae bacterium]